MSCLKEQPKVEEEVADKDESSTMPRPAKRARTSFTVDQLQVLPATLCAGMSVFTAAVMTGSLFLLTVVSLIDFHKSVRPTAE